MRYPGNLDDGASVSYAARLSMNPEKDMCLLDHSRGGNVVLCPSSFSDQLVSWSAAEV